MESDARIVFTSDRGRICPDCRNPSDRCSCRATKARSTGSTDGVLRVRREVKGRGGKVVTTISGVPLRKDELAALAGRLKRLCGTGGSAKDGTIEIQGDHVDRLLRELTSLGHTVKRAGG